MFGGKLDCECMADADCLYLTGGDLCKGVPTCDTSVPGKNKCAIVAGSVPDCAPTDSGGCMANQCDSTTGACKVGPANDTKPCKHSDACIGGASCAAGKCVGGINICACKVDADCAAADTGDKCLGPHFCDKSGGGAKCAHKPGSEVKCDGKATKECHALKCAPGQAGAGKGRHAGDAGRRGAVPRVRAEHRFEQDLVLGKQRVGAPWTLELHRRDRADGSAAVGPL